MKRKITAAMAILLLLAGLLGALDLAADASAIYDGTVRLHVLANSDSDDDQALKLAVRDRLLTEMEDLLESCSDRQTAMELIEANQAMLTALAEETVQANGYNYSVSLTLTEEYYETRDYDDFRLPAGVYTSLQVKIGEAAGHNWWCVLFPPLCTAAASAEEELSQTGFTKQQVRLLTDGDSPTYRLKFKAVEWFGEMKQKLRELFE